MANGRKNSAAGTKRKIRVLLVDDDPCVLQGLRYYLRTKRRITIVGQAESGERAIEKAREQSPDVVLMDLNLQGKMKGIMTLTRMREEAPGVKLLACTTRANRGLARDAFRLGAAGYVVRSGSLADLELVIERVYGGETVFSSKTFKSLPVSAREGRAGKKKRNPNAFFETKTEGTREIRTLNALARPQVHGPDSIAERAKRYIDMNLKAPLSVKVIASAVKTNPSDLERTFRRVNGVTIKRYVDEMLKDVVRNRLRAGSCKGCALAQELGFGTDQAFYRWVKRVFGIRLRQLMDQYH
jgi:DNA-binding NarL/FixJ family response regulator